MNFVFGRAYGEARLCHVLPRLAQCPTSTDSGAALAGAGCPEGYTPLMCAAHRGRLESCKALLRSGADPNFMNAAGDLVRAPAPCAPRFLLVVHRQRCRSAAQLQDSAQAGVGVPPT